LRGSLASHLAHRHFEQTSTPAAAKASGKIVDREDDDEDTDSDDDDDAASPYGVDEDDEELVDDYTQGDDDDDSTEADCGKGDGGRCRPRRRSTRAESSPSKRQAREDSGSDSEFADFMTGMRDLYER
jgi:hypothetical protein